MQQGSLIDTPPALPPMRDIQRAAVVEGKFRWSLTRRWGVGEDVLWCMLNPSLADCERDDPTLHAIMDFSWRWGYAGLIVVNLFPLITPHPEEMRKWTETGEARVIARRSLTVIGEAAKSSALHMAAWGNGGAFDPGHIRDVIDEIELDGKERKRSLHHLGLTQYGNPKHPLARGKHRIPRSQGAVPWVGR